MTPWIDHLLVGPQYLTPQHAVSKLAKYLAHIEQPSIKLFLIKRFLGAYDIDLNEALESSLGDFAHFNAFFTRRLKPGARPISSGNNNACSPADGILSEFGTIDQGTIIQAKGKVFSVSNFLAEPSTRANRYTNGRFATIYLAPNNYHRVHAPFTGEIISARYIPGDLFSVNRRTAKTVKGLFARNERVLVEFQTREFGRVMMVLVGALLVASIGLTFFDMEAFVYSRRHAKPIQLPINHKPLRIDKGQEVGWFNMGSTVVLLFENDAFTHEPSLVRGQKIKMGEKLRAFAPTDRA